MYWTSVFGALVAVVVVTADECTNYDLINDDHRSTQFVPETTDRLICDRALENKWYRFSNGDMPTSCVPIHHCGTRDPIWLDGRLPSLTDGIVTRKVCFNYGSGVSPAIYGGSTCCHVSRHIQVRNCGTFNVYHLSRTSGCYMAYCAGNKPVCKIGQTSIGSSTCVDIYPKMTDFPVLGNPYVDQNNAVQFPCHVPYPTGDPDVAFEVTWTSDGQSINVLGTHTPIVMNLTGNTRDAYLNAAMMRGHMGTTLKCKVRSYRLSTPGVKSNALQSNGFWAGIRAYPGTVIVDEKGPVQVVTVESTVPFPPCTSLDPRDCQIVIEMKASTNTADITTKSCYYIMKYDNATNTYKATIKVTATRDFVKDGDHLHELAFRPMADNPMNPMWDGYSIPPVQITSKDRPHGVCTTTGDPQVYQVDGSMDIAVYEVGDLVFYKSKSRPFEIQIRTWTCGPFNPCICAVVAREGNDVIEVDMCPRRLNQLTAPDVHNLTVLHGTTIHRDPTGKQFAITFPSGALLKLQANGYLSGPYKNNTSGYLTLNLQAPSDDLGSSVGLCGTYDGNANNNLQGRNGYMFTNITNFVHSWLLKPGTSMFDKLPSFDPSYTHHNPNYCQCDHANADCTKSKSNNPMAQTLSGYTPVGGHGLHPRRAEYLILGPTHTRLKPGYASQRHERRTSFPTPSGISKAMAIRSCTDAIQGATLFHRCQTVVPSTVTGFYIDACVKDMMISDSDNFNIGHMNTFDFECQDTVLRDVSNYAIGTHGERIPPADVTSHVCANQCSRRGTCHQGSCACHSGYTGADCSVPLGVAPVISHIRGDGLCDVRDGQCREVQVIAQHLMDIPGLKCRYRKAEIGSNGVLPYGSYIEAPASFISFLEVGCTLPPSEVLTRDSAVGAFVVSVSTDGAVYSSDKAFVIYDGTCKNCNVTGKCSLKDNSCLIDNRCVRRGEQNGHRDYCDPHTDPHSWTTSDTVPEINRYTSTGTGCVCGYNKSSYDCACCDNGGCQCGGIQPHICINCQHLASCSSYPDIIVDK